MKEREWWFVYLRLRRTTTPYLYPIPHHPGTSQLAVSLVSIPSFLSFYKDPCITTSNKTPHKIPLSRNTPPTNNKRTRILPAKLIDPVHEGALMSKIPKTYLTGSYFLQPRRHKILMRVRNRYDTQTQICVRCVLSQEGVLFLDTSALYTVPSEC